MGVIPMLTEVERQVVEILKERGGRATLKEVALELHRRGYSPRYAHGALYYMALKGVVRRAGRGTYELAEGGGMK
jgi:repressor of nif and glnA expression